MCSNNKEPFKIIIQDITTNTQNLMLCLGVFFKREFYF